MGDAVKEEQLQLSLKRLLEAIEAKPATTLMRDGMIQRFEFTIELFWKVLKSRLAAKGVEKTLPLDVLKEAYAAKWLRGNEEDWLRMWKDRNLTSHTYQEALAIEIAARIPKHFLLLQESYDFILRQE
jgi:nucleotidyltransferase substrate binding protein (TIGR01987 family)